MLSEMKMRAAYAAGISASHGDHTAGLRAVAVAAVKDAGGGEVVEGMWQVYDANGTYSSLPTLAMCQREFPDKLYRWAARPQASAAVPEGLLIAIQSHCDDLKRTAAIVRKILPAFENTASEIDLAANELLAMLAASQPEVKQHV